MPDGNDGGKVSADFDDFAPGNPHHEVEPMRANVGDGAEFASQFGFEPPVPVGGEEKPILEKTSVDDARLADGAVR